MDPHDSMARLVDDLLTQVKDHLNPDWRKHARESEATTPAERLWVAMRDLAWTLCEEHAVGLPDDLAKRVRDLVRSDDWSKLYASYEERMRGSDLEVPVAGFEMFPDGFFDGLFDPEFQRDGPSAVDVTTRLLRAGVIVASAALPPRVQPLMTTIRRCFALGLLDAALILCRSVIEVSVETFLHPERAHENVRRLRPEEMKSLDANLHEHAVDERLRATNLRTKVYDLKYRCNSLLHRPNDQKPVTEQEVLEAITTTVELVEALAE